MIESHPPIRLLIIDTALSYERPFWAPMHITLGCIPVKKGKTVKRNDKTGFNYQPGLESSEINSPNDAVFLVHVMVDGCRR